MFVRKYSVGWSQRVGFLSSEMINSLKNRSVLWVHAVSVGEVHAAIPMIRLLKERFPDKKLIFSTVTVTGHKTVAAKIKGIDGLFYFPFDIPWIIKRVIRMLHPSIFIFFETEIWPNLLGNLKKNGIPSVLVNGRISNRSFSRYLKIKWLMKEWIGNISLALMQTEEDRFKMLELGADPCRIMTTGNTKYDQLKQPDKIPFGQISVLGQWDWWVAGSTHPGEEEMILNAYLRLRNEFPRLGLIIAPRHPERFSEVSGLIEQKGIFYSRKSQLKNETVWKSHFPPVILLDTIGELSEFYYWATIAFIGGSLVPKGGHNILEAVIWGKAPFFGKYSENFKEMVQIFKENNAGIEISSEEELVPKIGLYLKNKNLLEEKGKTALKTLHENQGATDRNMDLIEKLISEATGSASAERGVRGHRRTRSAARAPESERYEN
ncbi:MAG: 3-deoxy-D-manno-octulosonic acid transferase [Nitrospirae bacterium]|nr:3-deoxy-D-manno-octulosonic acid transferase [Nitrospirota bacterium]MBI3351896.1 3-deoxy-D-manno-octulosonic acid transferase [Nitrospirota bacterium]